MYRIQHTYYNIVCITTFAPLPLTQLSSSSQCLESSLAWREGRESALAAAAAAAVVRLFWRLLKAAAARS